MEMTKLQNQACHLIALLSEEKLVEIVELLKKMTSNAEKENAMLTEQRDERQKRLAALDELRKAREKLIAMNIDWETELEEALREKYGAS